MIQQLGPQLDKLLITRKEFEAEPPSAPLFVRLSHHLRNGALAGLDLRPRLGTRWQTIELGTDEIDHEEARAGSRTGAGAAANRFGKAAVAGDRPAPMKAIIQQIFFAG